MEEVDERMEGVHNLFENCRILEVEDEPKLSGDLHIYVYTNADSVRVSSNWKAKGYVSST